MINKVGFWIAKGLLTITPFVLTFYLISWLILETERFVAPFVPSQYYLPGLGVLLMILGLAAIGALLNTFILKYALRFVAKYLERLPIIKTIYGAISDAVDIFKVKQGSENKKAVLVEVSEGIKIIGFVTNEVVADIVAPNEQRVAVYFPMTYQLGGYTAYIEQDKVTSVSLDVETAMRIAVTGGNSIPSPSEKR
jgi:uncharacterized membrane protein